MNQEENNILVNQLKSFDGLSLSNASERRMASKPLHDFFMVLLKEVGVTFLGLDKNSLGIYQLKTRWENIKMHLSDVEEPKIWDSLINEMNNIRQKVEHNDYYDPKPGNLKRIRKKAPEFQEWLIRVAREYYKKSKNISFKESYYRMLDYYIKEAEWLILEYGERTPHIAYPSYTLLRGKDAYSELKELTKTLKEKLASVSEVEKLKRSDLDNLITLVKIISSLKGREYILLDYSICPKCGGKITETQRQFGGSEDDPEPTGIILRIGCEKCDYEVHRETIGI